MEISDEIVEKAERARFEHHAYSAEAVASRRRGDEYDGELTNNAMRAALEAVAPAIRAAAMEEAAVLVETHTYTVSNREPAFSLQPSPRAKDDMHHRTIAAAIRSAKEAA